MAPRRFRFAPSPTRYLHVGNALAALIGWAEARRCGGRFILRIEDIDTSRSKVEYEAACLQDLTWLGIDWGEGPDIGGPFAPYRQSERLAHFDAALLNLTQAGHAYLCVCSRAEVRAAQRAPHSHRSGELPYPGTCRDAQHRYDPQKERPGGYRLAVEALCEGASITWKDRWQGRQEEDVRLTCGDFLLGRPATPSYQLAVCVDDAAMEITDVVRGRDLLGSTARQVLLHRILGHTPPRYAHHPLLLDEEERKLSKRDAALSLSALRQSGMSVEVLIADLAKAIGLIPPRIRHLNAQAFADALSETPEWHDARWTDHS